MSEPKQEMLFGHPKYEVENLANTIVQAREAETTKPDLYKAALKLLVNRQKALSAILRTSSNRNGK